MDEHHEQLLRGRVYGADHEDPGPRPGREYRELVGGPLDGLLLDVTGRDPADLERGAALATGLSHYGSEGRAHYAPRPTAPHRWDWTGDTP
ncbi:hypothetical protein K353_00035 [Kitasatospora sp. SolWspMP-SS2h]|uniref:hypothetical protein n=1 Tax=Kitasatospora sp. SolWspMP-SS2h TaxID=1305729 RepID=UPI000DB94D79|nr:hypothetical protein [Kitasatospora sp. SolWspMP-SS2h]RAJ46834.1 hypothetical protein K353_00035 [Kitasatospora sp. SolWspMP-SS2h]